MTNIQSIQTLPANHFNWHDHDGTLFHLHVEDFDAWEHDNDTFGEEVTFTLMRGSRPDHESELGTARHDLHQCNRETIAAFSMLLDALWVEPDQKRPGIVNTLAKGWTRKPYREGCGYFLEVLELAADDHGKRITLKLSRCDGQWTMKQGRIRTRLAAASKAEMLRTFETILDTLWLYERHTVAWGSPVTGNAA